MTAARPRPARVIGLLLAVSAFAIVLTFVQSFVYVPILNDVVISISAPFSLSGRIHVCGRTYGGGAHDAPQTMAEIVNRFGKAPPLTTGWFFAVCSRGGYADYNGNMVHATVMAVRVGEDAYVTYSLAGGPSQRLRLVARCPRGARLWLKR